MHLRFTSFTWLSKPHVQTFRTNRLSCHSKWQISRSLGKKEKHAFVCHSLKMLKLFSDVKMSLCGCQLSNDWSKQVPQKKQTSEAATEPALLWGERKYSPMMQTWHPELPSLHTPTCPTPPSVLPLSSCQANKTTQAPGATCVAQTPLPFHFHLSFFTSSTSAVHVTCAYYLVVSV